MGILIVLLKIFPIKKISHNLYIQKIPYLYIADGHHRAASAFQVGMRRRKEHPDYTGDEEFNYFLSVLFPDEQLHIWPYNRYVHDLNGLTDEQLKSVDFAKIDLETLDLSNNSLTDLSVLTELADTDYLQIRKEGDDEFCLELRGK